MSLSPVEVGPVSRRERATIEERGRPEPNETVVAQLAKEPHPSLLPNLLRSEI